MKFNKWRFILLFLSFFGMFGLGFWRGHSQGIKDGIEKQQKHDELNRLRRLDDNYNGRCAGC